MVLELAASSVEKKIKMQASILVGNYEFYYAAGKLTAAFSLSCDENTQPEALKEALLSALATADFTSQEEGIRFLAGLIERYRMTEEYDEQMAALFVWGRDGTPLKN